MSNSTPIPSPTTSSSSQSTLSQSSREDLKSNVEEEFSSANMKQLGHSDLWNETIATELYGLEKSCDSNCFQGDCHEQFSRVMSTLREFYNYEQVSFRINASVGPINGIKHIPRTTYHEFAIYVCSCFGNCLGLSVIHLNLFSPSFYFDPSSDSNYSKFLTMVTGRQAKSNILT